MLLLIDFFRKNFDNNKPEWNKILVVIMTSFQMTRMH